MEVDLEEVGLGEAEPQGTGREARSGRHGLVVAWVVFGLAVVGAGIFLATRSELLDVDEVRLVGVSSDLGE